MTTGNLTLTADFGNVGWREKHPFCVHLSIAPLIRLINACHYAYGVYALLLIDRPGDLLDYIEVKLDKLPPRQVERLSARRGRHKAWLDDEALSADVLPLKEFDTLFRNEGDETEPPDEAWLSFRDSSTVRQFMQQALGVARLAQAALEQQGPLQRHIVASARAGTHAFAYVRREALLANAGLPDTWEHDHTADFYSKLAQLLQDQEVTSVAYRGNGDHLTLMLMAAEQRRRADECGKPLDDALHLGALCNLRVSNDAWGSRIWFREEGLSDGDLYIEGKGRLGAKVKDLVEICHRVPKRYILSMRDEGSIKGFEQESGDGWVLYRKQEVHHG